MHCSGCWRKGEFYYCEACDERETERTTDSDPETGYNTIWCSGSEPYTAGDLPADGRGSVSSDLLGADLCILPIRRIAAPVSGVFRPSHNSKLYAILEQEETKVWQYSTEMLYSLFKQEEETGKVEFPDV